MGITMVEAKSVLVKSGLPGSEYVINPYTGCVHGCVYCYARFMKRFTAHDEAWGSFLDAKRNAPEVLRSQLKRRKNPIRETVFLSSVTDCYQPPEKGIGLTRGILEVLLEYQVPLSILTKSELVVRDIDLFSRFESCSVGVSLMSTDDGYSQLFEPRASRASRRIEALRELKRHGITTWAFISPFLPGFSDLETTVAAVEPFVDEIGVEAVNLKGGNRRGLETAIAERYPDRLADFRRLSADGVYWSGLEQRLNELLEEKGLRNMGFFRH